MIKVLLVLACCLCLGLMPPGSSAKNTDPGQQTVQVSSEIPKTEDEAKKLLGNSKVLLKDGKYQEAKELAEQVKKSNFKDPATEAEKLLSEIASLEIASNYLDAEEYVKAQQKIEEIIKTLPKDSIIRIKAEDLLKEVIKYRKQLLDVGIARRYTEEKKFDDAYKKLLEVIPNITNDKVLAKASKAWDEIQPTCWNKVWKILEDIWGIGKTPFYGLIILAFLVVVLWGVGKLWKKCITSEVLQIREANDDTNLGVMDLFLASLHQWRVRQSRANEGLLRLEVPRTAALLGRLPKDQLLTALDNLPTVGTVDLKGLAKILQTVCNWFILCPPWMKATFKTDSDQIIARVTLQRKNDQVVLLSRWPIPARSGEKEPEGTKKPAAPAANGAAAGASGEQSSKVQAQGSASESSQENEEQKLINAVDSLAFKVLYLLAEEEATVQQAEAFDDLRRGLALLNQNLIDEKPGQLKKIQEIFQEVRQKYPRLLTAYLYEGFALDLLGEHDEAARKLQFVREKALEEGDEKLSQRAAYNEAIAHLHNYTYEEVKESVKLLKDLIGTITDDTFKSPLKAMVYAAQAFAIAHLPLFWKEVEPKLPEILGESEILSYKEQRKSELIKWQQEVQTITDTLDDLEKQISKEITSAAQKDTPSKRGFPDWDRSDCRRLQLGIHDARAHFYLNCAVEFLDGPTPVFGEGFNQKNFLDQARTEFRQCELLQPPEAENLADIGTLFLFLEDYETARSYLKRAIKFKNETYEYAFYRLAQTYEKENQIDQVVETLKKFKSPPRLKEFKEMYEKYKNYPLLAPEQREKLELWYPLGKPGVPK